MIRRIRTIIRTLGLLGLALILAQPASAVPVDIVFVGTWDSTGTGNTAAGSPGLAMGQRYVIRITYNDASTVTTGVDVLNSFFVPSGDTMQTMDLTDAGHSLDIFLPMEGLDTGTPYIYQQNETTHFPAFIPAPTLNFVDGSDVTDVNNIIGLEFEGNFAAGDRIRL